MHLAPLIQDLAVILGLAAVVTLIFQRIRQPVALGYVIAGIIVGPHLHSLHLVSDLPNIRVWGELGVIFLMFSIGLDFSFRRLARVGVSSSITVLIEMGFMIGLGFLAGRFSGWSWTQSLFLGAIVSVSSTTIIFKTLDELKLRTRRFSERIMSALIVEDLMAILMLTALSTLAGKAGISGLDLLLTAGKLAFVVGAWFLVGYFWVPRFVKYVGRVGNDEMLTILSLGLCFSLVTVASHFHYSVALGAFIMGSILAESTESQRIEELTRPLKDLFGAVFFVSVGILVNPMVFWTDWKMILSISAIVVFGKVFGLTLATLITGQSFRTAIQVGFGMAQIGEFSFIIAGLGVALGVVGDQIYPVVVAVSILTTFLTPYFIRHSHTIAVQLESKLPLSFKTFLVQYSAWIQQRSADLALRSAFYGILIRWILNGIAVSIVFIVVSDLSRRLDENLPTIHLTDFLRWLTATVISSPFLWGMFTVFKGYGFSIGPTPDAGTPPTPERRVTLPPGGTLFISRLAAVFWIGIMSMNYFSTLYAVLLTAVASIALFVLFYRRLEQSYLWFESQFLSAFQPHHKSRRNVDFLKHLAPWDARLTRIKVHPNAEIAGNRLLEARLRSDHGLNVIAIQRGTRTIIAPLPDERIYPKDELLVLGLDEQVERLRMKVEHPPGLTDRLKDLSSYQLTPLAVDSIPVLVGKRVRDSGIREACGGMVVGIERAAQRIINPDSDLVLEKGDILFIVGEAESIKKLTVTMRAHSFTTT